MEYELDIVTSSGTALSAGSGLRWQNVPGTAHAQPRVIEAPHSVEDLVALVRTAAAFGQRVRPVGASRAASNLAVAPDILLHMSGVRGLIGLDAEAKTATFLAGTTIAQAQVALEAFGLELAGAPDDGGATIGGALATGAHGSNPRESHFGTFATELTLLSERGDLVEYSERKNPESWDAVRLGLGALGIIVAATLQVRPATMLELRQIHHPIEQLARELRDARKKVDHYQLEWRPGTDEAIATLGWRSPAGSTFADAPAEPAVPTRRRLRDRLRDGVLRALPFLSPVVDRVSTAVAEFTGVGARVTPVDAPYLEYQFPIADAPRVFAGLRDLLRSDRAFATATVTARMIAADTTWMSAAYGRDVVAVCVSFPKATLELFERVENRFIALGGLPTWSGFVTLRGPELAFVMPRYADFAHAAARLDPQGRFTNFALRRILGH